MVGNTAIHFAGCGFNCSPHTAIPRRRAGLFAGGPSHVCVRTRSSMCCAHVGSERSRADTHCDRSASLSDRARLSARRSAEAAVSEKYVAHECQRPPLSFHVRCSARSQLNRQTFVEGLLPSFLVPASESMQGRTRGSP